MWNEWFDYKQCYVYSPFVPSNCSKSTESWSEYTLRTDVEYDQSHYLDCLMGDRFFFEDVEYHQTFRQKQESLYVDDL